MLRALGRDLTFDRADLVPACVFCTADMSDYVKAAEYRQEVASINDKIETLRQVPARCVLFAFPSLGWRPLERLDVVLC